MKELAEAIITQWNANGTAVHSALADAAGDQKLWHHPAPQSVKHPHCTYQFIQGNTAYTMPDAIHDVHLVQFSVFDDNPDASDVMDVIDLIKAVYDDSILTLSGGKNMVFAHRQTPGVTLRDPTGESYQAHIDYAYEIG